MSICLGDVSRSCSIYDISRIFSAYALGMAKPISESEETPTLNVSNERGLDPLSKACESMFEKLLVVLDLRLRQIERKEHFPMGEKELESFLHIISGASKLKECIINRPLLDRVVKRVITVPDLWTEEKIVRFHSKKSLFFVFRSKRWMR